MNKTVAIITMHRVLNYGSILQTLALYKYIFSLEYDVSIVDYNFPNEYHMSVSRKSVLTQVQNSWLINHLNGICSRLMAYTPQKKIEAFRDFIGKNIILSHHYKNEYELKEKPVIADIYVTGSDQVWNPRYIGDDMTFALDWVNGENAVKVSYASSFGSKVCPAAFGEKLLPLLKQYRHLSLREDNEFLRTNKLDYTITLDPTFLLDKNQWQEYIDSTPLVKGRYILCYLIGYSYNPFPYVNQLVRYIHKETGLKVVMIDGEPRNFLRGYKLFNNIGPKEFLNLFYNTSFVLTTSFHGTAFAINFNKPFLTVVDSATDNDNRQSNIVNLVGLDDSHIVKCGTPLSKVKVPILQTTIAPKLEIERKKSQKFISTSLNG
ncbi:polysaccharide pyruvyl transferase family protein [uncultured Muribaculum sp.]|uniref:polysaccharide pyruvyl transferase family protein n=1 Tax=uncultured Muribaculum sp. TaxID=1918613 RepID=UPI00273006E7|nr:polysaccharide pyruvyl transferase family protein [uncultured Muribaculum sp.]